MGLFEKKYCDICGEKIGLLGNRKVEDGNVCSKCAKKLSPFFTGRRKSTVDDIKRQLAYREENRQKLMGFNPTRVLGSRTKVYIDEAQQCFVISSRSDYKSENADIIAFSQVTGARYNVEEHRTQLYHEDDEGNDVAYNPPRYEEEYEIDITLNINSPYFNEIEFELTDHRPESRYNDEFRRYEQEANEIVNAVRGANGMNAGMFMQAGQMMGQQPFAQQPNVMSQAQYQQNYGQQDYNQQYQQPRQNMMGQQNYQQNFAQQTSYQQPQGYQQPYQQPQHNVMGQQTFNQQYQQPQQSVMGQQPYNQQYQQPQQNVMGQAQYQQQFVQQQPAAWTCPGCGAVNTSRFCVGCGAPKP